jgi:hypothetical protein
MKNSTNNKTYNQLLDLCIQADKVKGVIQKSILEILKTEESQSDFVNFANSQANDAIFKTKISKFQNNLNQKITQELHFDIGEEEALTQTIRLKRDPQSTLPQSERPYLFVIVDVKAPTIKTLEEEIEDFKKKMKSKFKTDLSIKQK